MHLYSPVLLSSLLVTGLVSNFPIVQHRLEQLQHSSLIQQHLVASADTCTQTNGSPPPGCGRRE